MRNMKEDQSKHTSPGSTISTNFPNAPKADRLHDYIGQWVVLKDKYASDIPEKYLKDKFMSMLPDEVATDLRRRHGFETLGLQAVIDKTTSNIHRYNDDKLAKLYNQSIKDILSPSGPKQPYAINAVADMEAALSELKAQIHASEFAQLQEQLKNVVAAISTWRPKGSKGKGAKRDKGGGKGKGPDAAGAPSSGLPRPDPAFNGCWHCGGRVPGCTGVRTKCPEFVELCKKHNGLPKTTRVSLRSRRA